MYMSELIVTCPHCDECIIIEKLNCYIFRHGIFKNTGKQINPHASKMECDFWKERDKIFGCGKPFKIIVTDASNIVVEICDYI